MKESYRIWKCWFLCIQFVKVMGLHEILKSIHRQASFIIVICLKKKTCLLVYHKSSATDISYGFIDMKCLSKFHKEKIRQPWCPTDSRSNKIYTHMVILSVVVIHVMHSSIFFKVTSLALGQLYCPNAVDVALENMNQISFWITISKYRITQIISIICAMFW